MTMIATQTDRAAKTMTKPSVAASRLVSLDAFRGATMLFMASEILRIPQVARKFPDSAVARFFASTMDHREWVGCAPWDLIQPAFMFHGRRLAAVLHRAAHRTRRFVRQTARSPHLARVDA